MDTSLLSERLFLEAELPFFMLDTKSYPTTAQGKFFSLEIFNSKNDISGDSITIVRQLYNKYHSSLDEFLLPENDFKQRLPFSYHFGDMSFF